MKLEAAPDTNLLANPEGIDVSNWQGSINWDAVRGAGIEFAWMKATEGTTYKARTGRDVVICTSPSWWNSCTGGWTGMSTRSPLWVAHWTSAGSPGIPQGFPYWTVWQYTSTGSVSGISGNVDRDRFSGDRSRLLALANNTP
ncbi:hypothetical protein GCM10010431_64080 [Streptomyces kunmingensis]